MNTEKNFRKILRGDVYWADLRPLSDVVKHMEGGVRPVVVISNSYNNKYCDLLNVIPITSKKDRLPQHQSVTVMHKKEPRKSYLLPENTCVIHKNQLSNFICHLDTHSISNMNRAIMIQFELSLGGEN